MCRPGHPLTSRSGPLPFSAVRQFPIAATPLSDEMARMIVEHYGPAAHPAECVTLGCEELQSLVEATRASDAVLLAIRASAPDLVELPVRPVLRVKARFGLVTLAARAEAPALGILRKLVEELLRD